MGHKFVDQLRGESLAEQDWVAVMLDGIRLSKDELAIVAIDNVMIERLWRTVKYEEVYLKGYVTGADCYKGLGEYLNYYGHQRCHQSLDRKTPWEVYRPSRSKKTISSI